MFDFLTEIRDREILKTYLKEIGHTDINDRTAQLSVLLFQQALRFKECLELLFSMDQSESIKFQKAFILTYFVRLIENPLGFDEMMSMVSLLRFIATMGYKVQGLDSDIITISRNKSTSQRSEKDPPQ